MRLSEIRKRLEIESGWLWILGAAVLLTYLFVLLVGLGLGVWIGHKRAPRERLTADHTSSTERTSETQPSIPTTGTGGDRPSDHPMEVDDFFFSFTREDVETKYCNGWSTDNSMPDIGSYSYAKEYGLAVSLVENFGRVGKLELVFQDNPEHIAEARRILTGLFPDEIKDRGFDTIIQLGGGLPADVFGPLLVLVDKDSGYYVTVQLPPHNVAFGHAQRLERTED